MAKTGLLLFLIAVIFSSCAARNARREVRAVPVIRIVSFQDLGLHEDTQSAEAAVFENLGDTYDLFALEYDPWNEWCLKRTLYLDAVGYLNRRIFFDVNHDPGRLFRINMILEERRYIVFIHIELIFYSMETYPRGIIQRWTQWVFEVR